MYFDSCYFTRGLECRTPNMINSLSLLISLRVVISRQNIIVQLKKRLITRRPALIKSRAFSPKHCRHSLKLTNTSLWLQWKGIDSNELSSRVCMAPVWLLCRASITSRHTEDLEDPEEKSWTAQLEERESECCRILIATTCSWQFLRWHYQKRSFTAGRDMKRERAMPGSSMWRR